MKDASASLRPLAICTPGLIHNNNNERRAAARSVSSFLAKSASHLKKTY